MKFNIKRKDRGFTIVELLIVIVVIGILAALVLNSFRGVQERAQALPNIQRYPPISRRQASAGRSCEKLVKARIAQTGKKKRR